MPAIRRHDLSPRVELLPMLDVIFLLLTFFIYSLVVMVRAQVLPLELTPITAGAAAEGGQVHAITVDRTGSTWWNREPVTPDDLRQRLADLAAQRPQPKLLLAVESDVPSADPQAAAVVDRGPLLLDLLQRIRIAGVTNFALVGEPDPTATPTPPLAPAPAPTPEPTPEP